MDKTKLRGAAGRKGPDAGARPFWEIRQSAERNDEIVLYIYGDVAGDQTTWWGDTEESETSAEHFRQELAKYPDCSQITVYINSYGGSVFEGTAIYNQLRRHPAHKTVFVDGFACSIASVIAMAGDEVVMPRNTLMMIHNMWMVAMGNASQLRKAAEDLDVINAAGRQAYLQKAGEKLSEEELTAMMDAETWLTAEDCIRLGLADRYADEDADLDEAAGMLQRANAALAQQVRRNRELAAALRETQAPADGPAPEGPQAEAASGPEAAADGSAPEPVPEPPREQAPEHAEEKLQHLIDFLARV
jgi:ATP-dependent protease ClpP protease subunit